MNKGLCTSTTPEWETPQAFFDALDAEFHFTCDVCATRKNAKVDYYFSRRKSGLRRPWARRCWMNPPYGREIGKWMRKAYEEALDGTLVVCLVPARTDTAWWHDYAMKGEIRFVRGRLHFRLSSREKQPRRAPFPSAVVIFHARSPR